MATADTDGRSHPTTKNKRDESKSPVCSTALGA